MEFWIKHEICCQEQYSCRPTLKEKLVRFIGQFRHCVNLETEKTLKKPKSPTPKGQNTENIKTKKTSIFFSNFPSVEAKSDLCG